MTAEIQKGTIVRTLIKKILPFGLLVEVVGKCEGIIRQRELTWDQHPSKAHLDAFQVGQSIDAVVIGEGHNGLLNLSLRLVEYDPWRDLSSRYSQGHLVDGIVTGIQPYGVFVEIEPGVTGLLHRSQIPEWIEGDCTDLFWPGDHVYLAIKKIDSKKRRINFSLIEAWQKRWSNPLYAISSNLQSTTSQKTTFQEVEEVSAPLLPLQLVLKQSRPYFIAVVEDEPVQRRAMTKWLQKTGQNVMAIETAEAAIAYAQKEQFDLVVMDVSLPGMNGIEAMQEILRLHPDTRGILMTDWACANEYLEELSLLRELGVSLLVKPLLPEDLLHVLSDLGASDDHTTSPLQIAGPQETTLLSETSFSVRDENSVEEMLNHLHHLTYVTKVILFALDTTQRKICIVAESGRERTKQEAITDLIYSPVREVAEDYVTILVNDLSEESARVRYLGSFLNFNSCLGVPVPNGETLQYALFLFHSSPGFFTSVHKEYAKAVAIALCALLKNRHLHQKVIEMQRLTLLGNLTRSLVHEINHQLTPISFALDELQSQCVRVEQLANNSRDDVSSEMHDASMMLRDLACGFQNLVQTARLFGRITVQGQEQLLRLDTVIEEVVQMVRDKADRAHVTIQVEPLTKIFVTRHEVAQVQQILLNVFLNAILQIQSVRPKIGGQLHIRLRQTKVRSQVTFQITVEDDGPGIHRRLWDRIFDLGFTSGREEGSGLGLYITRSLIEAMGGHVYIAESRLFWGTKFIIEFPLRI